MAPTELLAEQHANNFAGWLEPLGIQVGWLAGKVKGKARAEQLARLASGELALIVGTHALFQEQVKFNALELVIIDEPMRQLIHDRAGELKLARHARTLTPSIRDDGWRKVLAGETTIEEVLRVTRED